GREYLDLVVRHNLAVGRKAGALPPAGLIQVAEILGGPDWQPDELDWRALLDTFARDTPESERTAPAVSRTLASSAQWSDVGISDSWFVEGQATTDVVTRMGNAKFARVVEYVARTVLVRQAERWAEHFVWV